jgi:hypothetical protein
MGISCPSGHVIAIKNTVLLLCLLPLVASRGALIQLRPGGYGIKDGFPVMSAWYAETLTEGRANS